MPPDLPQEIFDAIVAHIPASDIPTLNASAAVCTSFHVPSRRRLFHTLRLHRARALQRPTLEDAANLFESSPVLATYIRDITLEISDAKEDCAALDKILKRLAVDALLERLVISGKTARWNAVARASPTIPDALLTVMKLPSLQRLHIMNLYHVPPSLFTIALKVPVASFYQVRTRKDTQLSFGETSISPSPLRHLILADSVTGGALPVFECLLHSPPTALKRLQLRLGQDDTQHEKRLLDSCSDSLEELVVDTGELLKHPSYTLSALPHLHTLTLKVFINQHRQLPSAFLYTLALLNATNPNSLHTLILNFVLEPRYPTNEPAWKITEAAPGSITAQRIRCLLVLRDLPAVLDPRDDADVFEKFEKAMHERLFPFALGDRLQCELAPPRQGFYIDRLP
ncbi:hypothetical protein C8F01DRAFT_1162833 [Mycena amicta]|nr:hypothetical protein C8F01DRAFT_1162833 [Mycena amicta]